MRLTLALFHTNAAIYTLVDRYRRMVPESGILIDQYHEDPRGRRLRPRELNTVSTADDGTDGTLTGVGIRIKELASSRRLWCDGHEEYCWGNMRLTE